MSAELVAVAVPGTDRAIMATRIDGRPVVSIRHACEAIGMEPARQIQKLNSRSWATVYMTPTVAADGKTRAMAMVDRRTFTMWLATIDTSRVSAEARPIIEAFQAEAADALDAYFNDGGAINPRATEDQLSAIASRALMQAEIIKTLKGVIDDRHLEAKARIVLARAMGEAPELDAATTPLYVWSYLGEKGLSRDLVRAKASGFGKRLKALYIVRNDREPDVHFQELPDGKVRQALAYTEADRPLFDEVWAKHYANVIPASVRGLFDGDL